MVALSVIAITARTATVMIDADKARYHLEQPVDWVLNGKVQSGQTAVVPVFLDDLRPATDYIFEAGGSRLEFSTANCTGVVDITSHGASPDAADNVESFEKAIAHVPNGGTLIVPAGRFQSGPIFLKSDMTVLLRSGAEIAAIGDRTNWPILPERDDKNCVVGTWEGLPAASFASPVTAIDCDNLNITGSGTIDGGGDRGDWWDWPKETRDGARRPRTIFLAHCNDVILSGVTVRNSPSWTVHPYQCHGLIAAALRIENPADSPNTDGFDPESCTNVDAVGLRISVGDDCIAVKAGKRGTGADTRVDHIAPTRQLKIENCLMQDGHGAVVMGSEMSGDITDVNITRCEFKGTDRGLRIKTRRGRGGKVARISMTDVTMDGVGTAVVANAFYFCDADGKSEHVQSRLAAQVDETTPQIEDIFVEKLMLTNVNHAIAAVLGLPEAPINHVRLSDVSVTYDPAAKPGDTVMACHVPQVKHAGILHQFAQMSVDPELLKYLEEFPDAH